MTSLRGMWDRLNVEGEGADGFVRLRHPGIMTCPVYAARRIADGLEAVILEVHTANLPAAPELPQSAGMLMQITPLSPGRSGTSRIVLALTDPRYRDVFRSLGEDVLHALGGGDDQGVAVRALLGRVARWQAFLRQHGPDGLSAEMRVGLYGEIAFLRNILLPRMDHREAVGAWKGCSKASHDFQLTRGSVEIKATRAVTPLAFHVSNVKQLDDAGLHALFVYFVSIDENDGGEESLLEIVTSLRGMLSGEALDRFDTGLAEVGYLDVHQDQYAAPRYTLRSTRWFRVGNGFPRLLPEDLRDGVVNVSYSVALSGCIAFEFSEEHAVDTILGIQKHDLRAEPLQ